MFRKKYLFIYFPLILSLLVPISLFATNISRLSGVPVKNDIVLMPARVEISLKQGEKSSKYINVTNRLGKDAIFKVEVEDFAPSDDGGVDLDKTIDGLKSSLKKYISVDSTEFSLAHGEQAHISVTIDLPKNIGPGGLYAVVLISGTPLQNEPGAAKVITRLGAMFFVKVDGPVLKSGVLESVIYADKKINITFENSGDIHLNPYGIVDIYDDSNKLVKKIEIDPWFVLPRSTRTRVVDIKDIPTGSYIAKISMNRGYDDIIDSRDLNFSFSSANEGKFNFYIIFISAVLILLLFKYKL